MKRLSIGIILATGQFLSASHAQKIWEAPATVQAPEQAYPCRIVDYGDDYAHYRLDQQIFARRKSGDVVKLIKGLDLDKDGQTDDSLSYVEFSLDEPTVPNDGVQNHYDWDREGINARIYISRLAYLLNEQANCIQEGGGPNTDHSIGADDINMMGWSPTKGYMAGGEITKGWGLWIWKKEDFLNKGDQCRVSLDSQSRLSLHSPRYWTATMKEARFLVQDGKQFYLSEHTFSGGEGRTHVLNPTKTRWAEYNPAAPYRIEFDGSQADYREHSFSDVQSVGYFGESKWCGNYWWKLGAFEVEATVHRPGQTSLTLDMTKVKGVNGIPEFEISRCEIPYAAWQKVYRRAVANSFTIHPGYYFDKEADMGSMAYDMKEHSADEPATDITWLDAVNWCNALSEQEGKEPVYYSNPECTEVFRRTQERFLQDLSRCNIESRKRYSIAVTRLIPQWSEDGRLLFWGRELKPGETVPDGFKLEKEKNSGKEFAVKAEAYKEYSPAVHVKWAANGYRLPTAAEWSSAAGNLKPETGNLNKNMTLPVGSGKPNANGLYDMDGNVWEYVWDYEGAYEPPGNGAAMKHTVLGGDFHGDAKPESHSASAYGDRPIRGAYNIGFRALCRKQGLPPPVVKKQDAQVAAWTFDKNTLLAPRKVAGENPVMISVPGGSLNYQGNSKDDPVEITLSPFEMSRTEITYRQWKGVYDWALENGYTFNFDGDMGSMYREVGGHSHTGDEPVTRISWFDAAAWCNAKSEMEGKKPVYFMAGAIFRAVMPVRHPQEFIYNGGGKLGNLFVSDYVDFSLDWSADGYRLPTFMENLLVSTDGGKGRYFGEDAKIQEHAWTLENSGGTTHPVGTKAANKWGLFDLFGNVDELCNDSAGKFDPFDIRNGKLGPGGQLVSRGGSFLHPVMSSESIGASTLSQTKYFLAYPNMGFRIVNAPHVPCVLMDGKKYTVTGKFKDRIKEGQALSGRAVIDQKNRTIEIVEMKEGGEKP